MYDHADYLTKREIKNEENLVKTVVKRRIDIGVGNKPALLLYAEKVNYTDKIEFLEPPIDIGSNYFAFSKAKADSKQLAADFSAEVKRFKETDEYKQILAKYKF